MQILQAAASLAVALIATLSAAAAQSPPPSSAITRLDPALDRVLAPGTTLERVATGFQFGEGPMWREGRLWFSDLVGNRMIAVTPSGEVTVLLERAGGLANPPAGSYLGSNAMATTSDGAVVMAQHGARQIARLVNNTPTPFIERYQGKRLNSPNDLVFAADGALWFSDPPFGLAAMDTDPAKEIPFNGVYRFSGGALTAKITDLPRPNGLAFSPDGRTLYVSNSGPDMFIRAYRVGRNGALSGARQFFAFTASEGDGVPDGLKVDAAGNVWATGPGGIHIINPKGKLIGLIRLPEVAANLAWADGGKVAYITASTSLYRLKLARAAPMPRYGR